MCFLIYGQGLNYSFFRNIISVNLFVFYRLDFLQKRGANFCDSEFLDAKELLGSYVSYLTIIVANLVIIKHNKLSFKEKT